MYCRSCSYDLRGLDTARCPECGRAYDPDDRSTFFDRPGRFYALWMALKRSRSAGAIALTSIWAIWMLIWTPLLDVPRPVDARRPLLEYPHMITIQRMLWQQEDPSVRDFDREAAVRNLPPMPGAYVEQARIDRSRRMASSMRGLLSYGVPTALYLLLVVSLVRRRGRRVALSVLTLCSALVIALIWAFRNVDLLVPVDAPREPSHAYLDDYVQIDGIQFTSPDDWHSTTIAGYDKRSFEGDGLRIVAFANTHVRSLGDNEARALFEANGLEYPVDAGD